MEETINGITIHSKTFVFNFCPKFRTCHFPGSGSYYYGHCGQAKIKFKLTVQIVFFTKQSVFQHLKCVTKRRKFYK